MRSSSSSLLFARACRLQHHFCIANRSYLGSNGSSSSPLQKYGCHRVVEPAHGFPQAADVVDSTRYLRSSHEALIDVSELLLDSTSMRQYRLDSNTPTGTSLLLEETIANVIRKRGKCHSPYTNSGGVLIGTIAEKGASFGQKEASFGTLVTPIPSISAIPLSLGKIVDIVGNRIFVKDSVAVVFSSMKMVPIPEDIGKEVALTSIDISSLVPQVKRTIEAEMQSQISRGENRMKVLTIGCGIAGFAAMHTIVELKERLLKEGSSFVIESLAVDYSDKLVSHVLSLGIVDKVGCVDARDGIEMLNFTGGKEDCDVVINVVNIPDTETTSVLCAKPRGTVFWFSMATRFDKAALAPDAVGKDVRLTIGNGVAENQQDEIFHLVRKYPALRNYFAAH